MKCVNKNLREYQTLLKESGLPDFVLSAQVGQFLDKVGRFPHLDELKGANSEKAIKDELKLNDKNVTDTSTVLSQTHTQDLSQAVQSLNDRYRDKEIEIAEIGSQSKVYMTPRPSTNSKSTSENVANGEPVNSFLYFTQILDKFQDLYGINIHYVTNAELNSDQWRSVSGVETAKAFVYNGDIYVNVDIATIDSPIHEMLHILFGSMKFQNRELYDKLVSSSQQFKSYNDIAYRYPNRTREDVNEEVFITELAKYLTGQKSDLDSLSEKDRYEIYYNVTRTLDTILMGESSSKIIPEDQLYDLNLKTLATYLNSASLNSNYQGTLNDAALSRILANKKEQLIQEGKLKEECS